MIRDEARQYSVLERAAFGAFIRSQASASNSGWVQHDCPRTIGKL